MEITLDGKVALVSGASKGIGKAIAATLAASGAKVMLNSRKQDQLEAAAAEMTGEVDIFACNAGDDDAGERAVTATVERFGGLDILVNNAATNPYFGATLGVDAARYDKTFQVNLKAPLFWSHAAWEHAFKDRPGTIINIASVGGLRAEQTNIKAEGPLTDPTLNFQRDANGKIILGANGRPTNLSTDPVVIARNTNVVLGTHVKKEYLRWFPSINASYNLRENLVARAAWHSSIGRPNFAQYSGAITLPDFENPTPTSRIVLNNAAIKPWSAHTTTLALEYYFQRVGLVSVTAHRREFKNFFGTTLLPATPEAAAAEAEQRAKRYFRRQDR